jgi:hypothetical protein
VDLRNGREFAGIEPVIESTQERLEMIDVETQ